MTIAEIKNPLIRKSVVIFTVAMIVLVYWWQFIADGVRDLFGEDLGVAWRGME